MRTHPAIKPLVWEDDTESECTRCRAKALGGEMIIVELDPGTGMYSAGIDLGGLCFRLVQSPPSFDAGTIWSEPAKFPSIEDAKAVAEADYRARIMSALDIGRSRR